MGLIHTANIVCPCSSAQNKDIVRKHRNIEGLVYQKRMPSLDHKRLVIKNHNSEDDLGHDDADARANGKPSEHVDGTNSIALFIRQVHHIPQFLVDNIPFLERISLAQELQSNGIGRQQLGISQTAPRDSMHWSPSETT